MRIGIVGAGSIGGTLAGLLSAAGHEVLLANSRGPESLAPLVARLGTGVQAATLEQAATQGELVVVAVPYHRSLELPAAPFAGRVVVDTGNYYPHDGAVPELDSGATTSTERLGRSLAGATMVKAFNTLFFRILAAQGRPGAPLEDRVAVPYATDDEAAAQLVARLIEDMGYAPVRTGTLRDGRRQQPGTPIYNVPVVPQQARGLLESV